MRAAVDGVDVVGKGDDGLVIAVVILERDLRNGVPLIGGHVHDRVVQRHIAARFVHEFHERGDAALIAIGLRYRLFGIAAVGQRNAQSRVEERLLAQPLLQRLKIIFGGLREDLRVRLETDEGTVGLGGADDGELVDGRAALKALGIHLSLSGNFHLEPLGQGVDDRRSDAVQTARHLIAAAAELAARVQHG